MSNEHIVVDVAAEIKEVPEQNENRGRGKIARLPYKVREELNHRLRNGRTGAEILPWLNELPVVKKILAARFDGVPISEPNLSAWRHGGYKRWLTKQDDLDKLHVMVEDAKEMARVTGTG